MYEQFLEYLHKIKKPVFWHILRYLPKEKLRRHYEIVSDYPFRQGKYFRPGLLLLANQMHGGDLAKAVPMAAVVQTAEDWLLIHDDIEDHSLERRSKPGQIRYTLNHLYGHEIAINAGDALHVIMWKILGDAVKKYGPKLGGEIYASIVEILLTTIEGQYLELAWRKQPTKLTEKYYFDIIARKTAWYTVLGPIKIGMMLAGADSSRALKSMETWGRPCAYAFQIWDDVINATATRAQAGKDTASDIQEGKPTLMLAHLWSRASRTECGMLKKILQKPIGTKTPKEQRWVLELMDKYGSVDYAKKSAQRFCEASLRKFKMATRQLEDNSVKQCLAEAISFSTYRTK